MFIHFHGCSKIHELPSFTGFRTSAQIRERPPFINYQNCPHTHERSLKRMNSVVNCNVKDGCSVLAAYVAVHKFLQVFSNS